MSWSSEGSPWLLEMEDEESEGWFLRWEKGSEDELRDGFVARPSSSMVDDWLAGVPMKCLEGEVAGRVDEGDRRGVGLGGRSGLRVLFLAARDLKKACILEREDRGSSWWDDDRGGGWEEPMSDPGGWDGDGDGGGDSGGWMILNGMETEGGSRSCQG